MKRVIWLSMIIISVVLLDALLLGAPARTQNDTSKFDTELLVPGSDVEFVVLAAPCGDASRDVKITAVHRSTSNFKGGTVTIRNSGSKVIKLWKYTCYISARGNVSLYPTELNTNFRPGNEEKARLNYKRGEGRFSDRWSGSYRLLVIGAYLEDMHKDGNVGLLPTACGREVRSFLKSIKSEAKELNESGR